MEELGPADDTVVVFTSDHGDMMGDFRMLQKGVMHDSPSRAPLLIRVPRVNRFRLRHRQPDGVEPIRPRDLAEAVDPVQVQRRQPPGRELIAEALRLARIADAGLSKAPRIPSALLWLRVGSRGIFPGQPEQVATM